MKICSTHECGRVVKANGLCSLHYERIRASQRPICSVDGCLKLTKTGDLCAAHYFRKRMHGSPTGGRTPNGMRRNYLDNFCDPNTDECVLWPFSINTTGYGAVVDDLGAPHQIVCAKFHGPSPTALHEVAHGCGKRACINPAHLRWALHIENVSDTIVHGTRLRGENVTGAKLKEDEVVLIRSLFRTQSNEDIATRFGVSAASISLIGNRKIWKHIP